MLNSSAGVVESVEVVDILTVQFTFRKTLKVDADASCSHKNVLCVLSQY